MGDNEEYEKIGPRRPDPRHISKYTIKGFRSLQEFSIDLEPGLNVLLGVNGSGKTNFIDFLDFITSLVTTNCASAVSSAGGVARVFSQESLKRKIPRVVANITGVADLRPYLVRNARRPDRHQKTKFKFEYEVDVRYSKFHTAVYIANEKIKFKNLHSDSFFMDCDGTVGSVEIHRKSPLFDDEIRWSVGNYLLSGSQRNPLRHLNEHRAFLRSSDAKNPTDARKEMLSSAPDIGVDESLLSRTSLFPAFDAVRDALSRGRSFNLNPQKARAPDDISRVPIINSDGAGLSAVIYQMQQIRKEEHVSYNRRRFRKNDLERIISWTQVVLPELTDISATADPHTGKYIVYLHVQGETSNLKIPLQSTSDGTLKWLTFVSLVVAQAGEYTFEEPENFMHPMMQQYFVDLLRESFSAAGDKYRVIVSTHSETIINQCHPSELILFKFEDGNTLCKRVDNVDSLVSQINETGFGLGRYYARNVLR